MRETYNENSAFEDNMAAENRVLSEIQRITGLTLPRLQLISKVRDEDLSNVQKGVARIVPVEINPIIRGILYGVFLRVGSIVYLDELVEWYGAEEHSRNLEVLELALIKRTRKSTKEIIYKCLLQSPRKLFPQGLRVLARGGQFDSQILASLRDAYRHCLYDLETISVMANMYERDYALIIGPDYGCKRLTGSQCHSLIQYQVPPNEYGFRRADLIPYYAQVLEWKVSNEARLADDVSSICDSWQYSLAGISNLVPCVSALRRFECVPIGIETSDLGTVTRAIILRNGDVDLPSDQRVLKRGSRGVTTPKCDVASSLTVKLWVGFVMAPVPPSWNLFPKQLLRADHPLRHIKPD